MSCASQQVDLQLNNSLALTLFILAAGTAAFSPAATLIDDFSQGRDAWFAMSGDWQVRDGTLVQTAIGSHASGIGEPTIVRRARLIRGSIQVRVRPRTPGDVVIHMRHGLEQQASIRFCRNGDVIGFVTGQGATRIGSTAIESGTWTLLEVRCDEQSVSAFADGDRIGSFPADLSRMPGDVGLGLTAGSFDDFRLEGDLEVAVDAQPLDGSPRWKVQFSSWHPVPLQPQESSALHGSLYVYVRNVGDGPMRLADVVLAGQSASLNIEDDWVAYASLLPRLLPPGTLGELQIRVRGMPEQLLDKFLQRQDDRGILVPVTIHGENAAPVTFDAELWGPPCDLQLNVVTFSKDLRTVYSYLQRNRAAASRSGPLTLSRVRLNGADVTHLADLGQPTVKLRTVPLVIRLPQPLARGEAVCVTVETLEGASAGLAQRAFPGRFDVLVRGHFTQHRHDLWEDLVDHGVTHVSNMKDRDGNSTPPVESGLRTFGMAAREPVMLAGFRQRDQSAPHLQLTDYVWIDEVDKGNVQPVERVLRSLREVENYYAALGRPHQRYLFNCVRPFRGSAYNGHMTYPDVVMHARGYLMCPLPLHPSFGRRETMPPMEYRVSRKPLLPHHRDAEIHIPYDPETKTCRELHPGFQRILSPAEQRWLYYGDLIQGMKSIAHWGYWGHFERSGFYFLNEPSLRIGLGGLDENRLYDWEDVDDNGNPATYVVPTNIVHMLRDTWDEIGRLNVEMQAVGPLVAQSDVTDYAQLTQVEPATGRFGLPAAATAALVRGLDTIVIPVVNHHLTVPRGPHPESGPLSRQGTPIDFPPVRAQVELTLPPWLEPRHIVRVTHRGVEPCPAQSEGDRLTFELPRLEVSDLLVVTSSDQVLSDIRRSLQASTQRMRAAERKSQTLKLKLGPG